MTYWALERIVRSPWGRALKAIREDEGAAIALGKNASLLGCKLSSSAPPSWASPARSMSGSSASSARSTSCPSSRSRSGPCSSSAEAATTRVPSWARLIVWGLWSASGTIISKALPAAYQTQGGAVQTILIGLVLVLTLLFKPQGLIGEDPVVSRHVG